MKRLTHSVGLALCFGFALASLSVLTPSEALARPRILRPGTDPGLVLGAGAEVLAFRHFPDVLFDVRFGFLSLDAVNAFGPELEIGLSLGDIVVGASVQAGYVHTNPDGPFAPDNNSGVLAIGPLFEYWLPGDDMAPFVGAHIVPTVFFPDGSDAQVVFEGGARGGLHFFFGDVSLGPYAQFNVVYVSEAERAAYEIVLGFSFRGWVSFDSGGGEYGGDSQPAQPAAQPTWQPTNGGGGAGGAGGGAAPPPATDPVYDPEAGLE